MSWMGLLEQVTSQGLGFMTIGLVTDVEDPEGWGRVKVSYPMLDHLESDWLRVTTFFAGSGYGGFFHPHEGNEVLVAFLHGNPNLAYVIGALWNGVDKPPVSKEQQSQVSTIQTDGGYLIRFDETEDSPGITITDNAENKVVINTKDNKISISAGSGVEVTTSGGSIRVTAPTVTIQAEEKISLEAGSISITAGESLKLMGEMIDIN